MATRKKMVTKLFYFVDVVGDKQGVECIITAMLYIFYSIGKKSYNTLLKNNPRKCGR